MAEGAALEMRYRGNPIVGSNPTPSARKELRDWRSSLEAEISRMGFETGAGKFSRICQ